MKIKKILISIMCVFLICLLVLNPQKYSTSCLNGFLLFGKNVLPCLFPFFFLTKLLGETGILSGFSKKTTKLTQKLFRTSGNSSYIFIMSILSGYPVGAKLTADFYENGLIEKNEAFKISTFTSTSGPIFVIGTVGTVFLKNYTLALTIFASHITGAIINGIFYRRYKKNEIKSHSLNTKTPGKFMLSECMYSAISSILMVGGFIAFFTVFIDAILSISFLNLPALKITIASLVEVTRGCFELSKAPISNLLKGTLACFFISFGGFSIHAQAFAFLSKCEIPYFKFFIQKLTHAILSSIICFVLCLIVL